MVIKMSADIFRLCRKYTALSNEDIARLETMSESLNTIANIEQADVFIDCRVEDNDFAVVICQAKPDSVESSYKGSVVGMYAKKDNEPSVIRSLSLGVGTKHVKAVTQENVNVIQTVEPIKNNGRVIGVLIIEKRIDRRHTFSALNDIDKLVSDNSWLTKYIDLAVIMVSQKGIVCYRNTVANSLYKKLGYVNDILGMPYENIMLHSNFLSSFDDVKPFSEVEISVGGLVLEVRQILLNKNDISFATIIRDITNIHESEKQLVLKSVAIKEINHRVKNSLQTIASTLNLQMRRSESPEIKEMLQDIINRVMAVSATHELLLNDDSGRVNLGELIRKLTDNHLDFFNDKTLKITINIEGGNFPVVSDIANSVAIVINELLQNSFKHAFKGRLKGLISINIRELDGKVEISVTDDGCGFNKDKIGQDSLGFIIIEAIVKDKLHGRLQISSSDKGTNAVFCFENQILYMAQPM